jgi:hypothetical protein
MKIKESFIQCSHCSTKFRSPFFIGDTKTFSHAILWGNRVKCSYCEVTIDCNERNMSYVLDGEVSGAEGYSGSVLPQT